MISHFFIDRPIFAAVLSIVITIMGTAALSSLPIAQYPDIAPPTVIVTANYPGANAQTVLDTVAAPIEQQVSGVENMLYMSSQCANDGSYTLLVTFKLGMDANMAQVLVQNRVSLGLPNVPDLVQREGVAVKKISPSIMMIINMFSEKDVVTKKPLYNDLYMSNFATIQIRDELLRLPGVGNVTFMGQRDYSMRAWLNPGKMSALGLTTDDIISALSQQNLQVAAGSIGQEPAPKGQQFQLIINTLGRLYDVEQFENIIVKVTPPVESNPVSTLVRLKDIARVELGSQQYDQVCSLDNQPSVALSVYQLPGSNAISTANGIYQKMADLKKRFPPGLDYKIVYDTTPFIKDSIMEVFKTLRDAIILVALVVLVFLQTWRATLIPLIAVPVAVVGTFAAMAALGFSLNNLSLFGLVLAIGIVVDDAIVVVENVERWLHEGLSPRDAARKAMTEVTGPVIAVALVLCAVFIPCAFISGITGQFFRQFAITISVSTIISAFNSLTLSPALAALLLQPKGAKKDILQKSLDLFFGWFFLLFNKFFSIGTTAYGGMVRISLKLSIVALLVYGGLLYSTYHYFKVTPTGFIPPQDKGYLLANVQLIDAASVQRTAKDIQNLCKIAEETEGVDHTVGIAGQSLLIGANAPNLGSVNIILKPFEERIKKGLTSQYISAKISLRCRKEIPSAMINIFGPPPVDGLGTAGGFKMMIEDRGPLGLDSLQKITDNLAVDGNKSPMLQGLFTGSQNDTPWIYLDINRDKVMAFGLQMQDIFETLQSYFGSYYVNNFNLFGRSWQVNVMADEDYRQTINDLILVKVRNKSNQLVPLGAVMGVRNSSGPNFLIRYNMYPATALYGNNAKGYSSGQSAREMETLANKNLPRDMAFEWTELSFLQFESGNTAMIVFGLAVVFVFLVLAAQYESWSLPLAVILVVPMCLLSSLLGLQIFKMDINIFTQIGFVVLVGLASKNAILIVEFAKQLFEQGKTLKEATVEASKLRLRPILMTSFAFILGVVPLVLSEGAGAEMRQALGIAVFFGMLGVTFLGIFYTPVFFYVILWITGSKRSTPIENQPTLQNPSSENTHHG
ncbi:MAG: efflux RND transporter permease subunit [Planctomycetes bacterium]|nr:efflux RND transporter permease subunit [Planctomycetota bacterium]NBY01763.1 efflux RND transporter permease subunit [Planctomycetota bacterium]